MIKYPNNIKKANISKVKNYGNRGMTLEHDLNDTNKYYINHDIAIIHKKPTPIGIIKENGKKITDAYFKEKSTLDYNGIYKGYYIDFDAKETSSKTSFPLSSISNHQIKHIRDIIKHNGIVFLIIRFTKLNETYLLLGTNFINYIDNIKIKSIPISYFKENAHLIEEKLLIRLDYIKIIDEKVIKNGCK